MFQRFIGQKIRNIYDSLRFMPKVTRRRLYLMATIAATTTTTGLYVNLQTFKIDTFVEQLQMYRMRLPMPVDRKMFQLLDEAIVQNGFKYDREKMNLELFNTFGCDVYSIGNTNLPTGAFIGVPFSFNYETTNQININDMRLMARYRTKRTRDSEMMKNLLNSLILSDDAKRYILAHEINLLSSTYFFIKSLNIASMTLLFMYSVPKLNEFLLKNIKNGTSMKRIRLLRIMSTILCLTSILLLTYLTDQLLDYVYDLRSLRLTIEQNNKNLIGAKEYYEKLIKRNETLYELLGEYGPKIYTKNGNVKRLFGLYSTSYRTHIDFIDSQLFKIENFDTNK